MVILVREIKFRAWDKENKVMIYPKGILFDGRVVNFSCGMLEPFEGCELMQFTGLYDKNGKEIYEGDILYIPSWKRKYKVVFEAGMFRGKSICRWTESKASLATFQGEVGCKVIGNIYENSELIEGETK